MGGVGRTRQTRRALSHFHTLSHLVELEDASRPAVNDEHRNALLVLLLRLDVIEVDLKGLSIRL